MKSDSAIPFRMVASIIMYVICMITIPFALFSGAEAFGGGLSGVIRNSPNALPWIGLLLLTFFARKNGRIGGLLLLLLGLGLAYFFNKGPVFNWSVLIVTLLVPFCGVLFMFGARKTN